MIEIRNDDDVYKSEKQTESEAVVAAYHDNFCLRGADLRGFDLTGIDRKSTAVWWDVSHADLRGAALPDWIPRIPDIDRAILEAIGPEGERLRMDHWHLRNGCGTAHCRAGWAIVLAGPAGASLEQALFTEEAARLIYAASRPDREVPLFFGTNESAIADMRCCAGV